jgi:hypothetical protein
MIIAVFVSRNDGGDIVKYMLPICQPNDPVLSMFSEEVSEHGYVYSGIEVTLRGRPLHTHHEGECS